MEKRMTLRKSLLAATFTAATAALAAPSPNPVMAERIADPAMEVYGIVHWGLNTFTDREWGFGDEKPEWLDPKCFDADQIVGACKAAGMGGLVVVAKHHDGFCLWPTKTTAHNISKSPFRGGKGDYVKEMSDACRRHGLRFGVYVSPWDRNNAVYASEKYVTDVFQAQIRELLSGDYGEIFEMWFDGANGGDGYYGGAREKRKIPAGYYRYDTETFAMVRGLQPKVCIFNESKLADFHWPGNERGFVNPEADPCVGGNYGLWEADFPLRRGWFWHAKEKDTVRSGEYLMKLYLSSVGNGGTMNIGIAPNRDGLLSPEDVEALRRFGEIRKAFFSRPVADGAFNVVVSKNELGTKRIRVTSDPVVKGRRYLVDEKLLAAVTSATTVNGETDTAKWMTAARAKAEQKLMAAVPDIIARSAGHYRGLLKAMEAKASDAFPKRFEKGKLVTIPPKDWCSGFFPGSLWYLYEYTKDEFWKANAAAYTERLIEPLRHDANNHDVGFRTYCSAGNALRLTGESRYAEFLHDTAAALRTRYDDSLGLIRSWNSEKGKGGFFAPGFVVIIDNMMNLELLEWDAKNGGETKSDRIARSQADITDLHHFRPDGSAYHILDYNPKTKKIRAIYAGQGACVEGTWARGQAWAIYGYTMMYRETKDPRYLARAMKAADYWLDEPNVPSDGIPYWDFKAADIPDEPRDSSAAAVAASAFVELAGFAPDGKGRKYREGAVRILSSLASDAYFARPGDNGGFLLMHATGNKPGPSEVDVPLNYGDYYFLEALLRLAR